MEVLKAKVSFYWLPLCCAMTAVICYGLQGGRLPDAAPDSSGKSKIGEQSAVSRNPSLEPKTTSSSATRPRPAASTSQASSDDETLDWDTHQAMMKRHDSTTFTSNGTFPSGVGREMGLNADQIQAVQTALGRFWKTIAANTSARARYDEEASDPALKKDVYRIPALADKGQALRDEFQKNLSIITSAENAALLINGMSHQPFGDFGKYDVVVTFVPDTEFIEAGLGADSMRVSYEYTESGSGAAILTGTSTLEKFNEIFGPWSLPSGSPGSSAK
jgi:hypothetical protein